ncbi:MAG TPA: SHOCT domain-containing protein [Candidatus Dormibacteraeota bacterium]|nr:SHOCT domain-containing protein [Candidatus Dormibacteraeota bacterium]
MMWNYPGNGAWGWVWMTVIMLVFWGGLIVVAVWAIRSALGSRPDGDAMQTLRHRLASGEISQEDFEKTKRILQG